MSADTVDVVVVPYGHLPRGVLRPCEFDRCTAHGLPVAEIVLTHGNDPHPEHNQLSDEWQGQIVHLHDAPIKDSIYATLCR